MTDRIYIEKKDGKDIIIISHVGLDSINEQKFIDNIEAATQFIKDQGKDQLTLIDVTDAFVNTAIVNKFKDAAKISKPYTKKMAVVGVTGIKAIFLNAINLFSKLEVRPFATIEEAKKWLIA